MRGKGEGPAREVRASFDIAIVRTRDSVRVPDAMFH